jgi:hypothetical protein
MSMEDSSADSDRFVTFQVLPSSRLTAPKASRLPKPTKPSVFSSPTGSGYSTEPCTNAAISGLATVRSFSTVVSSAATYCTGGAATPLASCDGTYSRRYFMNACSASGGMPVMVPGMLFDMFLSMVSPACANAAPGASAATRQAPRTHADRCR